MSPDMLVRCPKCSEYLGMMREVPGGWVTRYDARSEEYDGEPLTKEGAGMRLMFWHQCGEFSWGDS